MNSSKHPFKINSCIIRLVKHIDLLSWCENELHLTDMYHTKEINRNRKWEALTQDVLLATVSESKAC